MRRYISQSVGVTLFFASVYYLFRNFSQSNDLTLFLSEVLNWPALIISGLLAYMMALVMQASCWALLCARIYSVDLRQAFVFQSRTQIYRYLPGGVFHYLARQRFAYVHRIKQLKMAQISLTELAVQLLAAFAIALLFVLLNGAVIETYAHDFLVSPYFLPIVLLTSVVMFAIVFSLLRRFRFNLKNKIVFRKMTQPLVLSVGYFLVNGFILAGIILVFSEQQFSLMQLASIVAAYSLAWAIGLLVPFAPAGIGVREAVLATLISFYLAQNITLIVLFHRALQIVGDAIYTFFFTFLDVANHEA